MVPTAIVGLVLALLLGALWVLTSERRAAAKALTVESARRNSLALELLSVRNGFMHSEESVRVGRAFKPRPTDTFIVTYPKCGTVKLGW